MAGSTAFASKHAPTFACIHTSKNVGEGLPPKALIDPGFSLPDPLPSRASPLPPLTAFTHQNVGGGLPPKALIDPGFAWPDLLPSRASPLPPLPAFTHQNLGGGLPPKALIGPGLPGLIHRLRGQARSHFWLHSQVKMWEGACPRRR